MCILYRGEVSRCRRFKSSYVFLKYLLGVVFGRWILKELENGFFCLFWGGGLVSSTILPIKYVHGFMLCFAVLVASVLVNPCDTLTFTHQWLNTLRRRQMDAISQTTFSNAFSWMRMNEFRLRFHWSLFPRVKLTKSHHWFRQWLGAGQATSHYLNQWWLVHWRIYASLGLNELTCKTVVTPLLMHWSYHSVAQSHQHRYGCCVVTCIIARLPLCQWTEVILKDMG